MSGITSIADVSRAYPVIEAGGGAPGPAPTPNVDFGDVLHDAIGRVNGMSNQATRQVESLAAGATDDIHGTMIAVQEASIGVRLLGSVRNKLLDAFHEVWHTGV